MCLDDNLAYWLSKDSLLLFLWQSRVERYSKVVHFRVLVVLQIVFQGEGAGAKFILFGNEFARVVGRGPFKGEFIVYFDAKAEWVDVIWDWLLFVFVAFFALDCLLKYKSVAAVYAVSVIEAQYVLFFVQSQHWVWYRVYKPIYLQPTWIRGI